MIRGVLFDFDGTLARSHGPVYEVIAELAREYRLKLLPPEELRALGMLAAARAMGLRSWRIPQFTRLARRKLTRHMGSVELEPGFAELLRALRERGLAVGLLTSNSEENVLGVLERAEVRDCFTHLHFGSSLLGKHRSIRKVARQLGLRAGELIYVGDELRDIEACKRAGVPCLAVGWGFHTAEALRAAEPDYFAATVEEACRLLLSAAPAP